jgi:hypothetical protein
MKRRKLHMLFLAASFAGASTASAQLTIDQATFTIQTGATVTVQGDVTSNVDIQGAGKIILKGSANQNVNVGNFTIPNLEIDNVSNATLTGSAKISGSLTFTNGSVVLGNNTLTLASAATVTGATSSKYVVTNGTGKLVKAALGAVEFTYPVGNSTTSYTPVAITNAGTADDIAVRAVANVLTGGTTGTTITKEVVNNTWDITEATAGGSNLTVKTTWNAANELPGFDRTRTGVSYYIPTAGATLGWDLLNSQVSAATGANPYTVTRTGVSSLGSFAVGTRPVLSALLVTPKVFLQGAYNTTNSIMDDKLRTNVNNLLPVAEPYSTLNLITSTLRGSGGGETSASSIVGSAAAASNNSIVDWVVVQLHSTSTNNPVISQRAALLQKDGDIVDVDGISPVNMAGNSAGNYYISIRHRNHLAVRTASTLALAKTLNTNYDFTTSLSQAFPGVVTNSPMATLKAGVFGMWAGNTNNDLKVTMLGGLITQNDYLKLLNTLGSSIATQLNVYSPQDVNMDGKVTMLGGTPALNDYLRILNTLGSSIITVTQPTL